MPPQAFESRGLVIEAIPLKIQQRNNGVTEILEIPTVGTLTIDRGWREGADTALAFVRRFVCP